MNLSVRTVALPSRVPLRPQSCESRTQEPLFECVNKIWWTFFMALKDLIF